MLDYFNRAEHYYSVVLYLDKPTNTELFYVCVLVDIVQVLLKYMTVDSTFPTSCASILITLLHSVL